MRLSRLWLQDFRCYDAVDVAFDEGCTVITGANGQGKTSLLEAVAWVASGRSFRGVPDAALVASGHDEAIVRAEIVDAAAFRARRGRAAIGGPQPGAHEQATGDAPA